MLAVKERVTRLELERLAAEWRYVITDMICRAKWGHIGGALSVVDILATLYYRIMKVDPANPRWEGRDRLVLSKGHAARRTFTPPFAACHRDSTCPSSSDLGSVSRMARAGQSGAVIILE